MSHALELEEHPLTNALLESWSSLMDLGRKGDAHKVGALAYKIVGGDKFASRVDEMLEGVGIVNDERNKLAKNGFLPVGFGGSAATATRDEKVDVATGCLVALSATLVLMKRAGEGRVLKEIGERLVGEEAFESAVEAKIAEMDDA